MTDVILLEWKREAQEKEIQFCSEFYYPTGSGINAFDISVILNNALQSAVENTGKNGDIFICLDVNGNIPCVLCCHPADIG